MASIKIPSNFDELAKLWKLIFAKHLADGPSSLLNDYEMDSLNARTGNALTHDANAKALAKQAEDATEDRDNEFLPVKDDIRAIAQFLKQKHRKNPKQLGDWGFFVDGE